MAKRRIKRILTSSERRKKIRRKRIFRLAILLLIVAILIAGGVYLLRWNYLRIGDVTIQGADDRKTEIQAAIESTLQGNRYLFIPNNQIFFYSSDDLQNALAQKFSYIQKVAVSKSYPHNLDVNIVERSPVALYCESDCYFLDSTGLIYASAPSFSSGVYMTFANATRATSTSPLQTSFTDEATFKLLQEYDTRLQAIGLKPVRITFIAPREIQIDVDQNGYILSSLDSPLDQTIENIQTVLLQNVTTFQYIDVRYGNKIFYKN